MADDLTLVRGRHQIALGANVAYWDSYQQLNARSGGQFTFNGSLTGLGLADFLTGRLFRLEQGAPNILPMDQTYIGLYAQDAWRVTNRVTVNAGMRWEPYLRHERAERRDLHLQPRELPAGREEHRVPQRARRACSIRATRSTRAASRA